MATVREVFISGTMGNIVFYRRMNKNCARMARSSIKQTGATKVRSVNFGIASRAGKALRRGLYAALPCPLNRSMQSRFSGAIAKWMRLHDVHTLPPTDAAPYISGFQFTNGATFHERFRVPVTVSQPQNGIITVSINAFVPVNNVVAPAGTVSMELVIAVAACTLATGITTGSATQRIHIPYDENEIAAQVLQFNIPAIPGSLIVTAAWLQYYVRKNNLVSFSEKPAFMPAGVVNARYG